MPRYHMHLESSTGPTGDVDGRELTDDDRAISEAGAAAAEVLLSELSERLPHPHAIVTVERDGVPLAKVRVSATIERLN